MIPIKVALKYHSDFTVPDDECITEVVRKRDCIDIDQLRFVASDCFQSCALHIRSVRPMDCAYCAYSARLVRVLRLTARHPVCDSDDGSESYDISAA